MKRKQINPDEEFVMNGEVFAYSVVEGNIRLRRVTSAEVKKTKSFIPPTLEEVKEFFKEKGYNEIGAKKAFDYYEAGGWKDGKGNQVKNWKQKMLGVWFRDEYKINEPTKQGQVHSNFFMKD